MVDDLSGIFLVTEARPPSGKL